MSKSYKLPTNERVKIHSAAKLFPMMKGKEFDRHLQSIRDGGQTDPVVLLDGVLLDGRNRMLACKELGIDCIAVEKTTKEIPDPLRYVLIKNLDRRHLSVQERAMIAATALGEFEKQAKLRQRKAGGAQNAVKSAKSAYGKKNVSATENHGKSAVDEAGKEFGVSGSSVKKAKCIVEGGSPKVCAAVKEKKLSLDLANELVKIFPQKSKQDRLLKSGNVAIRAGISAEKSRRTCDDDDPQKVQKLARKKAVNTINAAMRAIDDYNRVQPNRLNQKKILALLTQIDVLMWPVPKVKKK